MMNEKLQRSYTDSSIQTMPEISSKNQKFFKIFFILYSIINSITGIILDKKVIFSEKTNFEKIFMLKIFIYGYVGIFLTALTFGLILSVLFFIFYKIFHYIKNKNQQSINSNENTGITKTKIKLVKQNSFNLDTSFNEDEYSLINYAAVIFVFSLIFLYTVSIPYGIWLIYNLVHNQILKDYKRFYLLYVFILNNMVLGVVILSIFIYILLFIHIKISNKQRNITLNEDLINNIEREIDTSAKISGKISTNNNTNNNLIKINNLFNKQDINLNVNASSSLDNSNNTNIDLIK
jgi:hypothetical protein